MFNMMELIFMDYYEVFNDTFQKCMVYVSKN